MKTSLQILPPEQEVVWHGHGHGLISLWIQQIIGEKACNAYETLPRFRDNTLQVTTHIAGFCEASISSSFLSLFIPLSLLGFCNFISQISEMLCLASVLFDKPA